MSVDDKYVEFVKATQFMGKAIEFFKEKGVLELTFDRKNITVTGCYWWFGQSPKDAVKILNKEIKALKKIENSYIVTFTIFNNNQIEVRTRW